MIFGLGMCVGLWAIAFGLYLAIDGLLLGGFLLILLCYGLLELPYWRRARRRERRRVEGGGELIDLSDVEWRWPERDEAA